MEALQDALLRQAGLTGRYAANSVAGLGAAFANPLAVAMNYALEKGGSDYRFPDQYQALQQAMTQAGLPEPQGALEKGIGFAAELGVPDPTDSARVVAGISNLIDPSMVQQFPDLISAMTVFHGSPHKWDKPDLSKVGTGEGAQAYGHGFYVAESPDVAKGYADNLAALNAEPGSVQEAALMKIRGHGGRDSAAQFIRQNFAEELAAEGDPYYRDLLQEIETITPQGNLYELDLPDETIAKMLDWDKPLSEQPESVREALQNVLDDIVNTEPDYHRASEFARRFTVEKMGDKSGEDLHKTLSSLMGGDEAISKRLNAAGIPGIRYLDGTSRNAGEGTRNFVIFDEKYITPLKRNGEPIGLPMDEASRMQRAQEMGFDTDTVYYHGSADSGITEFDPSKAGNVRTSDWGNEGTYLTPSWSAAKGYAEEATSLQKDPVGDALYEQYEQVAKQHGTSPMYEWIALGSKKDPESQRKYAEIVEASDKWRAHKDQFRKTNPGHVYETYLAAKNPEYYQYEGITDPYLGRYAKERGHDAVFVHRPFDRDAGETLQDAIEEVLVLDPSIIRSTKAAFDPAKKGSKNILASHPAATVLGGSLAAALLAQMAGNDGRQEL